MLNKRDLPNAMSVPELTSNSRKKVSPVLEGVAIQGVGVFETLKESPAGAGGIEKGDSYYLYRWNVIST